jgi:hypothetical protein
MSEAADVQVLIRLPRRQDFGHSGELRQSRLEVLHDLCCDDLGWRKILGVFQRLVTETVIQNRDCGRHLAEFCETEYNPARQAIYGAAQRTFVNEGYADLAAAGEVFIEFLNDTRGHSISHA